MNSNIGSQCSEQPTNQQFLAAIFGDSYIYAHVTSFMDDPGAIPNDRRGIAWAGGYYKDYTLIPDSNQFYTVSTFVIDEASGKSKRRKANFSACYVIVLDDVEEKLPLEQVNRLPPPSIILRTSNGSFQWLYILNVPETSRSRIDNLHDQLIENGLAPDGNDPGQKGVTRYVRLPEGVNTKAKRIAENGGTAPRCAITGWNPERRYTMEQLAQPFNVDLDAVRKDARVDGAADVPDHPILKHVAVKSILSPGRYDITCPWVDTHTDSEDTGSALFTNSDGSIGFQCHHGHCQDKTARNVIDWINDKQPGFKEQYRSWESMNLFNEVMPAGKTNVTDFSMSTKEMTGFNKYSLKGRSKTMKIQMLHDQFVVGQIAILGQYTVIYAPPNAGKTLIMMREISNGIRSGEVDAEKVFYINADDNYKGLVTKLEIAEELGFHMLAPGHQGFEANQLVVVLHGMVDRDMAKGVIVILDTLKKFTDLMDKKSSSDFNSVVREFISKGGTVIALAHVNKHKNAEGNSVHAGTTDVKDDSDCVYIANVINDISDTKIVEFINEKSRGDVADTATYTYIKKVGMSYRQIFDSVESVNSDMAVEARILSKKAQSEHQNQHIIDAIKSQIATGVNKKTDIINAVRDTTGEPVQSIRKALELHEGVSITRHEYWQCEVGDRNTHIYAVNMQALPPELPMMGSEIDFL